MEFRDRLSEIVDSRMEAIINVDGIIKKYNNLNMMLRILLRLMTDT